MKEILRTEWSTIDFLKEFNQFQCKFNLCFLSISHRAVVYFNLGLKSVVCSLFWFKYLWELIVNSEWVRQSEAEWGSGDHSGARQCQSHLSSVNVNTTTQSDHCEIYQYIYFPGSILFFYSIKINKWKII